MKIDTVFFWPVVITTVLLTFIGYQYGIEAFLLACILSILEVTLSFDNAVVNAKVLASMSPVWQKRFLTWGILLAVFGTRFVLPILIVSIAVTASPWLVAKLAITDPSQYAQLLHSVHGTITAFGASFLMMVALKYFFNRAKDVHWIEVVEKRLSRWGNIEALEIGIVLTLLVIFSRLTHYDQTGVIIAGVVGLITFIAMQGLSGTLSAERASVAGGGLSLFLYLETLDTAFSLDGVVGAFALTTNLVIIMVGLGIGAYFVRTITLYLVERRTLTKLKYLEHGAHWAILGLSIAMFSNLVIHTPEVVTGLIGLVFVILAYRSSVREMKAR